MPLIEFQNAKCCMIDDEGNCIPFGKVSKIETFPSDISDTEYEKIKKLKRFDFSGELEFAIQTKLRLPWWILHYVSNNWRKLHGLPIRRRRKGRK